MRAQLEVSKDPIGTDTPTPSAAKPDSDGKSSKSKNLVGRLNNLVTTDMSVLQGGQAFMMLCMWAFVLTR